MRWTRWVGDKFCPQGLYNDRELFGEIYKEDFGDRYLDEATIYNSDVIECVRDVCNYIYDTHGRFPALCEAIHVPGIWLQVHHVEVPYYERFFKNGLSETQRQHQERWHAD